ncbi:hypothetical protein EJ06DRAFT_84364 [Trichodelitschia bisporula]|uniref:Uncharacterized protein n=1 Tax=Trichodelitschia bisporula TaxID=703511 RepID=A0A6G1HRN9_9PEZI|nr:hypothetical protein EJ06DRAFT_84364 [Trichodelitschia bisporula]
MRYILPRLPSNCFSLSSHPPPNNSSPTQILRASRRFFGGIVGGTQARSRKESRGDGGGRQSAGHTSSSTRQPGVPGPGNEKRWSPVRQDSVWDEAVLITHWRCFSPARRVLITMVIGSALPSLVFLVCNGHSRERSVQSPLPVDSRTRLEGTSKMVNL